MFWSIKNLFLVICALFLFSQIASAANYTEGQVDSRFDKGSASLARTWQDLKGSLPHDKIPSDPQEIKKADKWGKDYAMGLVKIVGPGIAICFLTLLGGIFYGIFKLIRMCCCSKKKDDDYEDDEEDLTWSQKWTPTILYFVFFVFLLTGMIFGLLNNPRFTDGVHDMGDSVVSVGVDAVDLGDGLVVSVNNIVKLIPESIDGIEFQFSGVVPLADGVSDLSDDINSTSSQVSNITAEVSQINVGANNTDNSFANFLSQMESINNSSGAIISQMADLTSQISDKLLQTYNDTIGNLGSKEDEIEDTVGDLTNTANDIIKQAKDLVHDVNGYVDDAKSYDNSRAKAVMALFVLVIVTSFVIVLGFVFRKKPIFNVVAALGFVFLFLLWLSGSIHFIMGMALYDACPVMDATVEGLLPDDSQGAIVLRGCLYEDRTVLESMNISAYNLSNVFDFKSEFNEVANFSSSFNFSAVDDYFASINSLYSYNLSAMADNITVASFGWNESYVYDRLDDLNDLTTPEQFTLQTWKNCDPSNYPRQNDVSQAKQALNASIIANATAYDEVAKAKQQLNAAQADVNTLVANMTILQQRYDGVKASINTLSTTNISNCIGILDNLQSNITDFFELGNCSFLGDSYVDIRTSLCETMQPAIDLLTVAQFLAGLALIPMVIIAEILSFRIPKCKSLNPLNYGDDDEEYDEEKGYKKNVAMETQHPISKESKRNSGISATISADPPTPNSATSSPDFSGRRRTIAEHFESHPPSSPPSYE